MPQSTHAQAAELHNLAAHAHMRAAASHLENDHRTAHELSLQAFEKSREAHQHSKSLATEKRLTGAAKGPGWSGVE